MTVRTAAVLLDQRVYVAGVTQDVATVAATDVWLVRNMTLDNRLGVSQTFTVLVLRSGVTWKVAQEVIPATGVTRLTGLYLAWEPGDVVRCSASVAGDFRLGFFGSRLVI